MDKHHLLKIAALLAAAVVITACTEAPTAELKAAEAPKQAASNIEPVLAKTAFYEMYRPARSWSTDILVLSVASSEVKGFKVEEGKAPMWTAVFVSPSRREARTVTYSIVEHDNVPKGVNMGGSQRWSGSTPKSQPFASSDFQANSDVAFQAALTKAGAFVKAHKEKPVTFLLGKNSDFAPPVWYIQWGDKKLGYAVFVNATSGQVMPGKY